MSRRLGPAHVVLGIGANRLYDRSARASLIRDAAERGHEDVEVSECVDFGAPGVGLGRGQRRCRARRRHR